MLLLKLFLVPSLIALITLAGRRWGPAIAGWLSGFPVVAGPVLLMIGIEQGPLFASQAAHSSLSAVLGNVSFSIGYSWAALRYPWYACFAAGAVGFILAGTLLTMFPLSLWGALGATLSGLWLAPRAFPQKEIVQPMGPPSRLELPARMLAGAVLSVSVTMFAQRLGPAFSGLFAVSPVMALVFGVFSHLTWGAGGAIHLLSGMVRGLYAFTAFCLVVAMSVPQAGVGLGFLIALVCALLVQAATFKRT
jgi:hypothetical protein